MLIYCGIDEAGYGPMLGPLTVGCSILELPNSQPEDGAPEVWTMLHRAVCKDIKGSKGKLVVNDSKKVKLSNQSKQRHPLTYLEPALLAFMHTCLDGKPQPVNDSEFYNVVCPGLNDKLLSYNWYKGEALELPTAVSWDSILISANVLKQTLAQCNIRLTDMSVLVMTEREFNERVKLIKSKSATSFSLVGIHLGKILKWYGDKWPRVIVDRQGSRAHYRQQLHTLFPEASIKIIAEVEHLSRYEINIDKDHGMVVTFSKSADGLHFPVAVASMLAKYVRELMMMRLNRYFTGLMPDLLPTAGYVQDARRFLVDIDPLIIKTGIDKSRLVRSR